MGAYIELGTTLFVVRRTNHCSTLLILKHCNRYIAIEDKPFQNSVGDEMYLRSFFICFKTLILATPNAVTIYSLNSI